MDKKQNNGYGVSTDELMDFLKDNMLTKEESKGFATKDDLKAFATKEDLGKFRLDFLDKMDDKFADLKGEKLMV